MDIKSIYNKLEKAAPSSNIKIKEKMCNYTSFKIGGIADILATAKSIEDIKNILKIAKADNIPLTVIGNGTNILVKDNGIRGIVLKVDLNDIEIEKYMQDVEMQLMYDRVAEDEENYSNNIKVTVGAGVKLGNLARSFIKKGNRRF